MCGCDDKNKAHFGANHFLLDYIRVNNPKDISYSRISGLNALRDRLYPTGTGEYSVILPA